MVNTTKAKRARFVPPVLRHEGPRHYGRVRATQSMYKSQKPHYSHGLNKPKLNNLYIGKKENWHLHDSQGKDLGQLTFAVLSDMSKGNEKQGPKIGPMSAYENLRREYFDVQNNSSLTDTQKLRPFQAREPLQDLNEKYYSHVIAEVDGRAVGFAAVDRTQFEDRENYVAFFYRPTLKIKPFDFTGSKVVKRNGHTEPLEHLIERISLDHIGGRNLLAVADASEAELVTMPQTFKALTPKFDIPSAKARTKAEYAVPSDSVHVVVRLPEGNNASKYQHGVELGKAFHLYNTIIREGYIDEYATVKDGKQHKLTRVQGAAFDMYKNGIRALVESAVKIGDKFIVPYKGADPNQFAQLNAKERNDLLGQYIAKAPESFAKYVRTIPNFK